MSVAEWFEIRQFPDGVIGIGEPWHAENVKSYVVRGRDLALVFDTGMGLANIRTVVEVLVQTPVLVVNSHSHWDHIGDNWRFDRIWIHAAEADRLIEGVPNGRLRRWLTEEHLSRPLPAGVDPDTFAIPPSSSERGLEEGDVIDLGDRTFQVLHTPGHSPGGITLIEQRTGVALVGDAVYVGALYAHLEQSDPSVYRETLSRLAGLASEIKVAYPSHGPYPVQPTFLHDAHQSMEQIWAGRPADDVSDGIEHHDFGQYSFLFCEGWRG